jgi:glycosyltransferase involved in cell wall biosynthesis
MVGKTLSITAIVAVKNEARNIERCLKALAPVQRVVVVDSNSTDNTVALAKDCGAEVLQFTYTGGYPKKRQWALDSLAISTGWVLLLDADEVVTPELWDEIAREVAKTRPCNAYLITKGFHFLGRRFRFGGFSHAAVLLFRKGKALFEQLDEDTIPSPLDMEVHERVIVDGTIGHLQSPLIHEDFKGLAAYIERHNHYSSWEAAVRHRYLRSGHYGNAAIQPKLFGNAQERRRFLKGIAIRVPFEPLLWFLYHYIFRLGLFEGRAGLIASQIRASYISQVRAKLFELSMKDQIR